MYIEQDVIGGDELKENDNVVDEGLLDALEVGCILEDDPVVGANIEILELPELAFVVKVLKVVGWVRGSVGEIVGLAVFVAGRPPADFIIDGVRRARCEERLELKLESHDAGTGMGLAVQALILDVVVP